MRQFFKRRGWVVLAVAVALFAVAYTQWKAAVKRNRSVTAEPFRIAGNFYYVGGNDPTAFLLTGPEGHVLIDGGWPETAPLIMTSITKLGFDIKDVKVLLNSDPHADHAGGLAELQRASGAQMWASQASAYTISSGGDDPDLHWALRPLMWIGLLGFPPARVDHLIKDGEKVRVGPLALTAHVHGGHTRGCTSWSFQIREGERNLNAVSLCSLGTLEVLRYPEQRDDFARTFEMLRSLPVDIWVTEHARLFGRYRKFVASQTAKNPSDPFIDPEGYRVFLDTAEKGFREGKVH